MAPLPGHVCEVCGNYYRTMGAYLDCLDYHEQALKRARAAATNPCCEQGDTGRKA